MTLCDMTRGERRADSHGERSPQSMEEINEILLGNDAKRLRDLKAWLMKSGMDERQFELSIQAQRLRHDVHRQQQAQLRERILRDPVASPKELAMGAFLEQIEPQVRDAVFRLREKGYTTVGSGFTDFHYQEIVFAEDYFRDLDPKTRKQLEGRGVKIREKRLSFECHDIDLQKIKATWDVIADILPDRAVPVSESTVPVANDFRKRFDTTGRLKPQWIEFYRK